jgi:hypothetical protein
MPHLSLVALVAAAVLVVVSPPAAASQADAAAAAEYAKPGFYVALDDGRLWVLREGSEELAQFIEHGEPAKQVVRPAAGPGGITLKSVDAETLTEYLLTRPGFWVKLEDGRLWVFREGSEELAQFLEHGEPAKQVVRPAAGPDGITLKAVDAEVLDAYLAAGE